MGLGRGKGGADLIDRGLQLGARLVVEVAGALELFVELAEGVMDALPGLVHWLPPGGTITD